MRKSLLILALALPVASFGQVDCKKLTRTVDEFTGTKKSYSSNVKKLLAPMTVLIYTRNETKEGDVIHMLRGAVQDSYSIMKTPKIELLMGNGETMTLTMNAESAIDNGIMRNLYIHSVSVVLSEEEVETLKTVAVTKVRLGGIMSVDINPKFANTFILGVRCASEPDQP